MKNLLPLYLFAFCVNVYGANKPVMTLEDALKYALNDNPEILVKRAEYESSRYRIDSAVGDYAPSLSFNSGYGREYVRQSFKPNGITPVEDRGRASQYRFDPSLSFRQLVFDALKTPSKIRRARAEAKKFRENISETKMVITFNVAESYISYIRFTRLIELARENVALHRSILKKIKALVAAGKATKSDIATVESRLQDARAAVSDIEGDLNTAAANYRESVGLSLAGFVKPKITRRFVPKNHETAGMIAMKNNKTVVVSEAAIQVAREQFKESNAAFFPEFMLQADARRNFNVNGQKGVETNLNAQLVCKFNVFNGGRDLAERRRLRTDLKTAKLKTSRKQRLAQREAEVSYVEYNSALRQVEVLQLALKAKKQLRDNYMEQFKSGTRSFIDILNASHEYFLARGSFITAQSTVDIALIRLYTAMGIALEVLLGDHEKLGDFNPERALGPGGGPRRVQKGVSDFIPYTAPEGQDASKTQLVASLAPKAPKLACSRKARPAKQVSAMPRGSRPIEHDVTEEILALEATLGNPKAATKRCRDQKTSKETNLHNDPPQPLYVEFDVTKEILALDVDGDPERDAAESPALADGGPSPEPTNDTSSALNQSLFAEYDVTREILALANLS